MTMQRRPDGWSDEQLQALADLVDAAEAFRVVDQVIADTGDDSPEAGALWAQLLAHQENLWGRLKAFTPAPAQ